ncbi:MAG: ferritin-like domain-containing protein [Longibaculum sp.]
MKYYVDKPYPPIDELDINVEYGQMMLTNVGGLHSEMNAVSLYFYNHVMCEDTWSELAEVMQGISLVEMHHLEIFSKMCCKLGVDPRLWDCQNDFLEYWSPGYNVYPRQINTMLENAIIQEQNTITIYQYQLSCIDEPIIQDVLKRIILDEQLHVEIFEKMLREYHQQSETDF